MKNYLKVYLLVVLFLGALVLFLSFKINANLKEFKRIELKSTLISGEEVYVNGEKVKKYPFPLPDGNITLEVKNYGLFFWENRGLMVAKNDSILEVGKDEIVLKKGEVESGKFGVKDLKVKFFSCTADVSGNFKIYSEEVKKGKMNFNIVAIEGTLVCDSKKYKLSPSLMFTISMDKEITYSSIPLPTKLIEPKNLMKIGLETGNRVNFSWTNNREAKKYLLEISYNKAFFNSKVYTVYRNEYRINFVDFKDSPVYWRVYSVSKGDAISLPSEYRKFYLEDLLQVMRLWNNPPKLIVEEPLIPQGNLVIIKGETERGVKLIINGSEVNVDNSGKFMHVLSFDKIGEHSVVIKAINLSGREKVIVRKVFIYEK